MLSAPLKSFSIAALALLICSGCQLWRYADGSMFSDSYSVEMLDALRDQLNHDSWQPNTQWTLLDQNPAADFEQAHDNQSRWIFGRQVVNDVINQLDTVQPTKAGNTIGSKTQDEKSSPQSPSEFDISQPESATSHLPQTELPEQPISSPARAQQWNGFWPLNLTQVLDSMDGHKESSATKTNDSARFGTRHLAKLATEDTISGWNATILLAQRDAAVAVPFLPVLAKIASSSGIDRKQPQQSNSPSQSTPPTESDEMSGSQSSETAVESPVDQLERLVKTMQGVPESGTDNTDDRKESTSRQTEIFHKLLKQFRMTEHLTKKNEKIDKLENISNSMRAAAAEAWCRVLAMTADDPFEGLAEPGRLLERSDLPDAVRGELFRGVSRRIAPSSIPRLTNALRVSSDEQRVPLAVRQAAIDGCLIFAFEELKRRQTTSAPGLRQAPAIPEYDSSLWPKTILNCQADPDARVRQTFGRWLAAVHYVGPMVDAYSTLKAQLQDRRPQVRDHALISLGVLGTESARRQLREQAKRPEPLVRAAAVRGLGWSGAGFEEFVSFSDDPSFGVRRSAIEQLVRFPSARTAILLREKLTDRDLQVQQAVIQNVERWPDQLALPLLLHALRDGSRPTRQQAFAQIRRRRTVTSAFSAFESNRREERVQPVMELASRLDISLEYLDQLRSEQLGGPERADPVRVGDIEADIRVVTDLQIPQYSPQHAAAFSRLKRLQPADVKIIENYLLETGGQNAPRVYQELLPILSPAHQAILDLQQADLQLRRRGAKRLRELSEDRSLSRLVVRRLSKHLDNKQDVLVYRDAMAAVMPDANDENAQIALRALNDSRPEIRLLGCQYVLRHPSPQSAAWLMNLRMFHDDDKRVRLAAIEAAGRSGNLRIVDDIFPNTHNSAERSKGGERLQGLRSLLTESDSDIRMAAVISMCHLADQQAMQELIRLSWNPEKQVRIRAVRAMGETGVSRFIGPLIRLGWTERQTDVRRSLLVSLQQLTLPGKRPPDLYDESPYDVKIEAWVDWWEKNQRSTDRARNVQIVR